MLGSWCRTRLNINLTIVIILILNLIIIGIVSINCIVSIVSIISIISIIFFSYPHLQHHHHLQHHENEANLKDMHVSFVRVAAKKTFKTISRRRVVLVLVLVRTRRCKPKATYIPITLYVRYDTYWYLLQHRSLPLPLPASACLYLPLPLCLYYYYTITTLLHYDDMYDDIFDTLMLLCLYLHLYVCLLPLTSASDLCLQPLPLPIPHPHSPNLPTSSLSAFSVLCNSRYTFHLTSRTPVLSRTSSRNETTRRVYSSFRLQAPGSLRLMPDVSLAGRVVPLVATCNRRSCLAD